MEINPALLQNPHQLLQIIMALMGTSFVLGGLITTLVFLLVQLWRKNANPEI